MKLNSTRAGDCREEYPAAWFPSKMHQIQEEKLSERDSQDTFLLERSHHQSQNMQVSDVWISINQLKTNKQTKKNTEEKQFQHTFVAFSNWVLLEMTACTCMRSARPCDLCIAHSVYLFGRSSAAADHRPHIKSELPKKWNQNVSKPSWRVRSSGGQTPPPKWYQVGQTKITKCKTNCSQICFRL